MPHLKRLAYADPGVTYVFFRFRLQVDTVVSTTFRDSHFLLIDIANATDHNFLGNNGDIAGGAAPTSSITVGWTNPAAVPEPTAISLIAAIGILALISRRGFAFLRNCR